MDRAVAKIYRRRVSNNAWKMKRSDQSFGGGGSPLDHDRGLAPSNVLPPNDTPPVMWGGRGEEGLTACMTVIILHLVLLLVDGTYTCRRLSQFVSIRILPRGLWCQTALCLTGWLCNTRYAFISVAQTYCTHT